MVSPTPGRTAARCTYCDLNQFRRADGNCRRCQKPLPAGTVETTTVVLVGSALDPTPAGQLSFGEVRPMREVQQQAARRALAITGQATKAAKALGIGHHRLKQLLREAGDDCDRRRLKRGQGRP